MKPLRFKKKEQKPDNQLQISIHPVVPINNKQPAIIVRYHNAGRKPISLTLPSVGRAKKTDFFYQKGQIIGESRSFRELSVEINGYIKAKHQVSGPVGDVIWTRDEKIAPGKHVDLKLLLSYIYIIPEDWRTIDIKTSMIYGIEAKVIGNLKLEHIRHTFLDPIHITAEPILPMDFDDPTDRRALP